MDLVHFFSRGRLTNPLPAARVFIPTARQTQHRTYIKRWRPANRQSRKNAGWTSQKTGIKVKPNESDQRQYRRSIFQLAHSTARVKTDTPLFKKALTRLPKKTTRQFSSGTPEFVSWMRQHHVPETIVDHFNAYSVTGKSEVEVGFANFWPEHLIRTFHDDTPEYFRAGWLIVGAMPNGDFVVLDIGAKTGAVSYVSHEEIWDSPHHVRDDLHNITIRICDSIGQFLDGLLEDRYPYDYFEARDKTA